MKMMTAATAARAEQAVQARIEVAPELVEVGRAFAGAAAFLGLLRFAFRVMAPAWVIQRVFDADFF
jgi:hypothetical protein